MGWVEGKGQCKMSASMASTGSLHHWRAQLLPLYVPSSTPFCVTLRNYITSMDLHFLLCEMGMTVSLSCGKQQENEPQEVVLPGS